MIMASEANAHPQSERQKASLRSKLRFLSEVNTEGQVNSTRKEAGRSNSLILFFSDSTSLLVINLQTGINPSIP